MSIFRRNRRRSRRIHSLWLLALYCLLPVFLLMGAVLLYGNISLNQMIAETSDSQMLSDDQLRQMRHMQEVQLPLEHHLLELDKLVTRFRSEFELLVLDPERSDVQLHLLRQRLATNLQGLEELENSMRLSVIYQLIDRAGLVLDLIDELLETEGSNDRFALYRDTVDPLASILRELDQVHETQEQANHVALNAMNEAAGRSRTAWEQLIQDFIHSEKVVMGLLLLVLAANSLCWITLARALRQRVDMLANFSAALAEGQQQRVPFLSSDSTGKLAISLGRTARRLRELLKEARYQATLAEGARKEAEQLALYDPLTGLANRRSFNYSLDQVLRSVQRERQLFALFYLDLDNFKYINDSLGHDVGDELLIRSARRLKDCMREGDFIARLGGDEFAVLARGGTRETTELAQRMLHQLSQPVDLTGQSLMVSCSIGIAFVRIDGNDASTLQKNADLALYKAKGHGRNNFQFFSPELHALSMHRMRMVMELRQAYDDNRFFLQYQPKYNLNSGELCSMEALIRWSHDQEGVILPDDFIPLAEETGLIADMGVWVLRQACADLHALARQGVHVPVAVNLSGRQFYDEGLAQTVQGILNEYDVEPRWLELEVTETVLIDDIDASVKVLQQLRKLGVSIAIDDFGMGFSSLNYLKKLPIDVLKIDRSFVCQVPYGRKDCAIIKTIVELAQRLGLAVVAEGIESAEQQAYLQSIGCNIGQGFYLARPARLCDLELARDYSA